MKKNFKYIALITIFLVSFLLMLFSAIADSSTTDEGIHLFAGYTYLTQKDFRLDPEHPPLIKEIAALPLLVLKPNYNLDNNWQIADNYYYDSWKETRFLGDSFIYSWGNNADQLLLWSRIMMILVTLCLGLAVYFYAKKLYGEAAGIFAVVLTLFCPIVLAHGRLVNTDIGLTLFGVLAIYFWSSLLKKQNLTNFLGSGIFLGLALASKYTAAIFILIFFGLLIIYLIFINKKNLCKLLLNYIGVLIITLIVVWAMYGFKIQSPPVAQGGLSNQISIWTDAYLSPKYDQIYDKIRPFIIPADFYKGLELITRHVVSGNGSFLLGYNSYVGWWYYFPVALFFKLSSAIFIFLFLSIKYFKKIKSNEIFDEYVLVFTPLTFLLVSMLSHANLGVRHVLPILPFIFIFVSKSINLVNFQNIKLSKISLTTLVFSIAFVWYILVGILSFPNYIACFNEFAGGSKNGYRILTDSNLDWGQDIHRIKKYLDANNIDNPYLVYPWGGDVALKYYDINYTSLTPDMQNIHGNVIISATYYNTDAYSWLGKYHKIQITPGVFLINIK